MESELFAYVWQYTIDQQYEVEFLAAYRPDGDWSKLFLRDPEYIETKLLRDHNHRDRYMTVDYWTSKRARDSFREKFAVEFNEIDKRCEKYTHDEVLIGDYVVVGKGAA
jgi:hypothetical protein